MAQANGSLGGASDRAIERYRVEETAPRATWGIDPVAGVPDVAVPDGAVSEGARL